VSDAGLFPVFVFNGICEKAAPVVRPFAFSKGFRGVPTSATWEFVLPCQTVVLNKSTFMRMSLVLLAAVALTGCQTFPPGAEHGPHGTMAYQVPIEASDAGVKVYANGELVGETPFTLKVFGDPDGTFHNFGSDQYVLQAVPTTTNQFMQIRVFQTGGLFMPEDRIPSSVHFDMNQPSPTYVPFAGPNYYYAPPYYYYGGPYYGSSYFYYGSRGHYYGHGYYHHGGLTVR
jgi:hypothetical protein